MKNGSGFFLVEVASKKKKEVRIMKIDVQKFQEPLLKYLLGWSGIQFYKQLKMLS